MMPDQVLSSTTIPGEFIHGDTLPFNPLVDYEPGGVALNDASQGLFGKLWTLQVVSDIFLLSAADVSPVALFTRAGTTECSLAFDQNMRPTIAFVAAGQATLWWYDSIAEAQVFTDLAAGVSNPRVTLDDKRPMQSEVSDVILAYLRAGALYFRAQRDRYEVEYLLASGVQRSLRRISMNNKLRLQFEMGAPVV